MPSSRGLLRSILAVLVLGIGWTALNTTLIMLGPGKSGYHPDPVEFALRIYPGWLTLVLVSLLPAALARLAMGRQSFARLALLTALVGGSAILGLNLLTDGLLDGQWWEVWSTIILVVIAVLNFGLFWSLSGAGPWPVMKMPDRPT